MERLLDSFEPENYQLKLDIDREKAEYKGEVVITGTPKKNLVKLHAKEMEIDEVCINDVAIDSQNYDGEMLIFPLDDLSKTVIKITYHKPLNRDMQSAYLSTYQFEGKEERLVSTQFESHYARECFPCIDEPAAKATFDLTITTANDGVTVLANTSVKAVEKSVDNSTITTTFETTPKMSTYLLAFVIGRLHSRTITSKAGVTITSYCALNQDPDSLDYANRIAADSLDYYDEKFGLKYPLPKLDQVAIPDFEAGAMENWGLVTYRESMMLANKDAAIDTKRSIALTIAHELSHQWFGDLVTMAWWDDLWLNESFASVMEYFAVDHIHPEYNIWQDFFTLDCLVALKRDALPGVQAVQQAVNDPAEISTLFDGAIVYAKGAHLMLMLIRSIGEEKFFKGIKDYFDQHKYQNTIGDDLWNSLQPYADFDVKEFMHAWISQPGYPVVTDESQQRFLFDGSTDGSSWPIPVISDDMSGHYLINLSAQEFDDALKTFANLSLEQRLRLLIDHMLLAKTPIVSSASLVDLIDKFKEETSSPIWDIICSIVNDLKLFFPPESQYEPSFHTFVRNLITPNLKRIGILPRPEDGLNETRLRSGLLALAYYSKDEETLRELAKLYQDDISKIHSEIRFNVLCAKLYFDESQVFDQYINMYQTVTSPEIKTDLMVAITMAKSPEDVDKLLDLLRRQDVIKPQDHLHFYVYLLRNHKTKNRAFTWLTENWGNVERMTGEKSIEDYPRYTASTVINATEQNDFNVFFDQFADNPTLSRAIKVAKVEINARLDLIKADSTGVHARVQEKI